MFHSHGRGVRPGWTCVECVVVVILVGLLASLLCTLSPRVRSEARLAMDLSNLGRIASATSAYAADYEDHVWTLSWRAPRPGEPGLPTKFPPFKQASNDFEAGRNQALDILARTTGRDPADFFPIAKASLFPHLRYGHIVLLDYLGEQQPSTLFVASGDRARLNWSQDIAGFEKNAYAPLQPDGTIPANRRWPYSASFQMPPAWYDQSDSANRIEQAGVHDVFVLPHFAAMIPHRFSSVAHPSAKVLLHSDAAWNIGRSSMFFAHPSASVPMLMADGAAHLHRTSDSNPGWSPRTPLWRGRTIFSYQPRAWEPPAQNRFGVDTYDGQYRWTRQGILGRDFGGPEVE